MDNDHGLFFTNIEETGQTLAIDVRKRAVVSTWRSCDDPSGVAVDTRRRFVFVACTDHVIVLDTAHDGRIVGSIPTGAGVDNIDYAQDTALLYAAAADAAQLTIAQIDDQGKPASLAKVPTTKGARSVVAGANESAYLIDPLGGNILKVRRKWSGKDHVSHPSEGQLGSDNFSGMRPATLESHLVQQPSPRCGTPHLVQNRASSPKPMRLDFPPGSTALRLKAAAAGSVACAACCNRA
jgi:hypothetical protein